MGDLGGARRYGWYGLAVAAAAQALALVTIALVPAGLRLSPYAPGVRDAAVGWFVVYRCGLALVLLARFRSGAWRRIALVEPAPIG